MSQGLLFQSSATETVKEAITRGRKVRDLIKDLRTAPGYIANAKWMIQWVEEMLKDDGKLTANHWDAMNRYGAEFDQLATQEELDALRSDETAWTPVPEGWIGLPKGYRLPNRFTPSERQFFTKCLEELDMDIHNVREYIEDKVLLVHEQLAVGPLHPAYNYDLTESEILKVIDIAEAA